MTVRVVERIRLRRRRERWCQSALRGGSCRSERWRRGVVGSLRSGSPLAAGRTRRGTRDPRGCVYSIAGLRTGSRLADTLLRWQRAARGRRCAAGVALRRRDHE